MVAGDIKLSGADDPAAAWGDFAGSDDECDIEDASESPERYERGIYYPICIGEVLADRASSSRCYQSLALRPD
ncbi:hypothetical protein BHE90_009068 [Fusarium euwallaceae]|uniref:Uncharacterized protein n=1 Tax=Fusarium euwallaceae TaxID=1147111 RepID=A0A430LLC3_9HYPO|nr:hypothetical protein BHE90_009068 [Fusarium euwallaceae]